MLKNKASGKSFSRPIITIALISIALGVTVILVSMCVAEGFKKNITDKVIGFGSHIQIHHINANVSQESVPVEIKQDFYPYLDTLPEVKHIEIYALKPGLIQVEYPVNDTNVEREIQGIICKGVDSMYDWSFINYHLYQGNKKLTKHKLDNKIIISKKIAQRLSIKLYDTLSVFFIKNNQPIKRKLIVDGIYNSGMEDFDNQLVYTDIELIQDLNDWGIRLDADAEIVEQDKIRIVPQVRGNHELIMFDYGYGFSEAASVIIPKKDTILRIIAAGFKLFKHGEEPTVSGLADTMYLEISAGQYTDSLAIKKYSKKGTHTQYCGGFEVLLNNLDELKRANEIILKYIPPEFSTNTINQLYPEIFNWLEFLDVNTEVIFTLMLLVSLISMCATLLVLILERTQMIGLLKAIGATNKLLAFVFLRVSAKIILWGLIIGNIISLSVCLTQYYLQFIKLNEEVYFIAYVPVHIPVLKWLMVNALIVSICLLTLMLPAAIVSKIKPIRSIKFQ